MAGEKLARLEREVEAARAKVSADLAVLTSPRTIGELRQTVEAEALAAKERFLAAGRQQAHQRVNTVVDTIRAKAAANPLAVAAIGAGVAYRLFRHPPVASVLIGTGVYSLLSTDRHERPFVERHGLDKTLSNVHTRVAEATEAASVAARVTTDKATELAGRVRSAGAEIAATTSDRLHAASEAASGAIRDGSRVASNRLAHARTAVVDESSRDSLLLGLAGLAVASAVGIALQRRRDNQ